MKRQAGSPLTPQARQALLSRVDARSIVDASPPEIAPPDRLSPRVADLPGFREVALFRSVQMAMGFEDPFYRLHQGRAGSQVIIDGRPVLNFSTYDYLALNAHADVLNAAKTAIDTYGLSASASRITAGERIPHHALESELAEFYGVDDCVVMVSGHATNVTTIGQIVDSGDLIVLDSMSHNSIMIGAKLSGAERRAFVHNDLADLERLLATHRARSKRALIVVEGLYSMDGDVPNLPKMIEIKKRYDAWLMVDEAHALGVLGRRGRGVAEHWETDPREVDIWMGTLSKTLASCGGYIAGSSALIDYLKFTVSGHVYSVGIPPALAESARIALQILAREPERVTKLIDNGRLFIKLAKARGLDTGAAIGSAIVPIIIGDSMRTVMLAERLFHRGLYVMPIVPPGVPDRSSRLRFFITLHHSADDIRRAVDMTKDTLDELSRDSKNAES